MDLNYTKSAKGIAEYFLFYNVAQKLYYTNNGINFFLYVMSGTKFRTDLIGLFGKITKSQNNLSRSMSTIEISNLESSVEP